MKVEEWKYGYVNDNFVVVFNNPIYSFRVLGSYFLEGVKLRIGKDGTLRITGTEIVYYLYLYNKAMEFEWKNEPEESEIQVRKVGLSWKRRKEKYLEGWVKTKKRIPFDVEFGNGWKLERRDVNEGLSEFTKKS